MISFTQDSENNVRKSPIRTRNCECGSSELTLSAFDSRSLWIKRSVSAAVKKFCKIDTGSIVPYQRDPYMERLTLLDRVEKCHAPERRMDEGRAPRQNMHQSVEGDSNFRSRSYLHCPNAPRSSSPTSEDDPYFLQLPIIPPPFALLRLLHAVYLGQYGNSYGTLLLAPSTWPQLRLR